METSVTWADNSALPTADCVERYLAASSNMRKAINQVGYAENGVTPFVPNPSCDRIVPRYTWISGAVSVACVAGRAGEDRATGLHIDGLGSVIAVFDGNGQPRWEGSEPHPVQRLVKLLERDERSAMRALLTTTKPLKALSELVSTMQQRLEHYPTWGAAGTIVALRSEGVFGIGLGDVNAILVRPDGTQRLTYVEPVDSKRVRQRSDPIPHVKIEQPGLSGSRSMPRLRDTRTGYGLNMASAFGNQALENALDRKGRQFFVTRRELTPGSRIVVATDGVLCNALGDAELSAAMDATSEGGLAERIAAQAWHRLSTTFPLQVDAIDDMGVGVIDCDDHT